MVSLARIGAGLSGLSGGLHKGFALGKAWNEISDEREIRDVRESGITAAQAARDADVAAQIQMTGGANGVAAYKVGDQTFADETAARAAAEKAADPLSAYYTKNVFPKMYETYMAQGNIEKATAWQNFYDDQNTKAGMKHWSAAAKAAAQGDHVGFGKNLVKLYNSTGYFEDGIEAKGAEPITDKDGNLLGYKVELYDPKTKETRSEVFSGQDDLLNAGLGALSPEKAFEVMWSQKADADKARLDAATDDKEFLRKAQLLGLGNSLAMERDTNKAELDAAGSANKTAQELEAKLSILRGFGFDDAAIKEMVPELVGAGLYRKGASPDEQRRLIWDTLTKASLPGIGFAGKSTDEQSAVVDEIYRTILGGSPATPGPAAASGAALDPPPSAGDGKTPVYDTETGTIVYR